MLKAKKILLRSLFFSVLAFVFASHTSAATITVNSNGDSGAGTLRQAITDIGDGDNTAGSKTDITVQVSTPSVSAYPVIQINTGPKTTTLRNLTLRGGTIYMYSSGAFLVLENCIVKDGKTFNESTVDMNVTF